MNYNMQMRFLRISKSRIWSISHRDNLIHLDVNIRIYRLTRIIRCAAYFHTHILASKNYWADSHEILHGYLLDDYSSDSRSVFGISIWNPRYGVPPQNF